MVLAFRSFQCLDSNSGMNLVVNSLETTFSSLSLSFYARIVFWYESQIKANILMKSDASVIVFWYVIPNSAEMQHLLWLLLVPILDYCPAMNLRSTLSFLSNLSFLW